MKTENEEYIHKEITRHKINLYARLIILINQSINHPHPRPHPPRDNV